MGKVVNSAVALFYAAHARVFWCSLSALSLFGSQSLGSKLHARVAGASHEEIEIENENKNKRQRKHSESGERARARATGSGAGREDG